MSENLEASSAPWKAIAYIWDEFFTSPSRISPNEVRKYADWLQAAVAERIKTKQLSNTQVKTLVLGATPELRDILNNLECSSTIIDINFEMIMAMNSLMKTQNPQEIVVKASWLDNPLQSEFFDIVVGDAVLPNVTWRERPQLLREVARLLKNDGTFITRAFCVPRQKRFVNLAEIIKYFENHKPLDNVSSLEFIYELQILTYNPADHLGTFSGPEKLLRTLRSGEGFSTGSKKIDDFLGKVWETWCVKFVKKIFTYAYRDEEELQYGQFFNIREVFETDDHPYGEDTPMYVMQPKSVTDA